MTLELFVRYLHFLSIIVVSGALISEHMLLANEVSRKAIKKIARIDALYGIFAIILLFTGLTLWLWVGKDAAFYSKNPIMHIKVTLFVIMALFSIVPTIFFLRQQKGEEKEMVVVPKKIFMYQRIQLLILVIIPLCAVLIARGVSF